MDIKNRIMKLKTIVNMLDRSPGGSSVLSKVFNSINDFKRKVQLLPGYAELHDVNELYQNEKIIIGKQIIADDLKKAVEDLKPEESQKVPPHLIPLFNAKLNEKLESDIVVHPFKFRASEIRDANLSIDEMMIIRDLYDINELNKLDDKCKKPINKGGKGVSK